MNSSWGQSIIKYNPLKLFTIILLALWSVNLNAQSLSEKDESDIRIRLDEYFELTKANNYTDMMDYLYPKIFTLATREQLIAVFDGLETMGIGLNVDEVTIKSVEPLYEGGDKRYALSEYGIDVRLELLTAQMQSDEVRESLKASFKALYNTDVVNYDAETKMLSFTGSKSVVCILDPEFDAESWFFLEYDASNPQLSQMLLGADAHEKLMEKIK